jgi:acetyl coenzyme A synthetase (ADP forming)-like protein
MPSSDLKVFFRPQGVAVIGASREPHKLGYGIVRNLRDVRYEGEIYPVNPNEEEILGYKVYRSVSEIEGPQDLAVISVPAQAVPEQIEACGKRGIKGAIVVSGGFRETGPEGAQREKEIAAIAAKYNMRIIGPNCIGTIDAHTPLNTTFVVGMPRPGDIAFVSQSGAMAAAVMDWAVGSGVGFSRIVSLGNQLDVGEAEMLEAIGQDGKTRVVTGYIEGTSDGRRFVEAASRTAKTLPLVFLKAGRGKSGAKAVASHTGALAGDMAAYESAFRRAGVLWAHTMEELFDWGRALAWQPLPQGSRVAILTNAGGPAILAADALEDAGPSLAPLTSDTKAFLRRRVFAAASVENPVDILAGAGPATYALCLDALLADETVDAVAVIQAPQDWFSPLSLAEVIGEVANSPLGRKKPILSVIMGLASTSEATQILHRKHIPNFAFPERIGSTLGAMYRRKLWLDEQEHAVSAPPLSIDVSASMDILKSAGSGWLDAHHVEALLNAYGIPVAVSSVATTPDDAVKIADRSGYPVVLKLVAEGVTHKTDVGGVMLNIQSDDDLLSKYESMIEHAKKAMPDAAIKGVLVQQQVQQGVELILGVVQDPQFGPLLMVGSGGTEVELKKDVAFELAPVTASQANAMLDRTTVGRVLAGFRGKPASDRAAVVDVLVRLAQLATDNPGIAEMEINPLIVHEDGHGAIAVDARVRSY